MSGRVRIIMAAVVGLLWGGMAMADLRPAEMPPADFSGSQYIDSRGCVFLRGDGRWQARRGPDDQPVCGFPPSVALRGADAAPAALPQPTPLSPEQRLMTTLAQGLRDGELIDDRAPREDIRPAAPAPRPTSGPLAELDAMVAGASALRAEMTAGVRPNDRLCALLGYEGKGRRLPTLGHDATQGFCAGLTAQDLATLPMATPFAANRDAAATEEPRPATVAAASTRSVAPRAAVRSTIKADRPATPQPRDPAPETVPYSARYVLIGRFADEQEAQNAIVRLVSLGYPASRGKSRLGDVAAVAVLAGPLQDRRSVIAALNDLRRRGYRGAVAQ
ncbi:MAG: SPOR domain-containing protein [Paracoccus sp. (in: a-proteobacteria)]|nr:SPOR domain-containing protein [Paracoccus sp. (in: a-proteobacteria)]